MAETYRLRYDGLSNSLGASISSSGATSITFASALQTMGSNIPTLAADQYIVLVIDNEIIHLTAYTAAATSGTISRGKEGTTGATHSNGATVIHPATALDFLSKGNVVVVTTTYTAFASDVILANAASAGFTITLPAPTAGAEVTAIKTDGTSNVVTLVGASGATINGDPSGLVVSQYTAVTLIGDGTNWLVRSAYGEGGTLDTTPWLVLVDVWNVASTQTNFADQTINAALPGGGGIASTGAQNAQIGWDLLLGAGTWSLDFVHYAATTTGIATIAIDGVTAGTIDFYNGTTIVGKQSSLTGIVIPATKKVRVTVTMATQNGSSSGYYAVLEAVQARRTS